MAGVCLLRKQTNKQQQLVLYLANQFFSLKFNHNFFPPLTILSNVSQVPLHSDTFRKAFGKMFKRNCWCIRCIIIMSQLGQYLKYCQISFCADFLLGSTSASDSVLQEYCIHSPLWSHRCNLLCYYKWPKVEHVISRLACLISNAGLSNSPFTDNHRGLQQKGHI